MESTLKASTDRGKPYPPYYTCRLVAS